jgi:iron complex transport system substrate-binding protein
MKVKPLAVLVVLLSLLVSMTFGCHAQFQPGTYTDDTGRGVTIDEIPQRIVSFGPSITEILFALGLGERVVGVSDFSDYPEEAKSKPSVGSAYSPSIEKLVELEPDLVFTLEHEQLNSELEALGIKFLILDPDDIDGIFSNIELVGAVTGTGDEATELIDSMEDTIDYVLAQVEGAPAVSVFFIVDATDMTLPWTSGPGSFIDALITMAGGENIASEAPNADAWMTLSIEYIVGSDPEVIIIQTMTGGIPTVSIEALEEHPIWGEMTAVIQGNVFLIDGDLVSRPGPRIVQGLEELARIIHPELFD